MSRLTDLIAERTRAWEQVQTIRDALERDGAAATEEQDTAFRSALDDVDRLTGLIGTEERAVRLDSVDWSQVRAAGGDPAPGEGGGEDRDERYGRAFRSWLSGGAGHLSVEDRDVLTQGRLDPKEARALGVGTNTAGGYAIPPGFRAELIQAMRAFGGMLEFAQRIDTDTGANLQWPTLDDTANVGAILAENTQITEQDVVMGTASLDAYLYTSKLVRVSLQLLNDSSVDPEGLLRGLLAERLGRILNAHFTTGTGTAQPDGIMTTATVGKQGATGQTTTVTYDDLVDVVHSIDPAYRGAPDVGWMTSDSFLKGVRKLKDSTGLPLWQPSIQVGAPDTLLGYPIRINQDMATPAASAKSALFGSIRTAYVVRIVSDVLLVQLNERYMDFLQRGFFSFLRADGTMQNAAAVRAYQQSAT